MPWGRVVEGRGCDRTRGRRQRRVWLLVGVVCGVVAVAATGYVGRQLSRGGLQVSDTAGLAAVALAVVAGLVAVVALRKQAQANTAAFADASLVRGWAGTLARQVQAGEGAVRRQLLGDDTERINLVYRLDPGGVRPATAPGAGKLFTDGGGTAVPAGPDGAVDPVLPDIVAFYRQTRPERLVVTGAGGAGKTVSALELLLGLVKGRGEDDPVPVPVPVPVRVPLSRWDTGKQTLPQRLERWLVDAYDWPRHMAAGLVGHGMVLPVLDGLDEMDPPGPGGTPDPEAPRATAAVEALNAYQCGVDAGPLVLTCQTGHYDALHPQTAVVDAARVEVEPVGPTDALAYLTGQARDPARWEPLTDHLAAEPGGMLAGVLSTPWRLGLVATVYHRDGDPGELLALPDAGAVDSHLLARSIPAAVRTAHNPRGYTAAQVHRWLHHLTTHLDPTDTASTGGGTATGTGGQGREGTDLLLHELWPLAGRGRVKATNFLLGFLAVLTALPLAPTLPEQAFVAVIAAAAGVFGLVEAGAPKRWTNPLQNAGSLRQVALRVALGMAGGIMAVFAAGITVGIMGWISLGITAEPGANRGARSAMRDDAFLGIAGGITIGVAAGITAGLLLGVASRRYLVFLALSRGRLPFRLGRFLDWGGGAAAVQRGGVPVSAPGVPALAPTPPRSPVRALTPSGRERPVAAGRGNGPSDRGAMPRPCAPAGGRRESSGGRGGKRRGSGRGGGGGWLSGASCGPAPGPRGRCGRRGSGRGPGQRTRRRRAGGPGFRPGARWVPVPRRAQGRWAPGWRVGGRGGLVGRVSSRRGEPG